MLDNEIQNNLRLRRTYRWLFLILFGVGIVPLVLGIWFIVLGAVPAGAISTAAGVFLEVTGLFSKSAAKDADSTAEKRISELHRSQDKNDSFEEALYAASTIEDPAIRANLLRDLALNQVGIGVARPQISGDGQSSALTSSSG
jgi:hypothetical protein